MRAALRVQTCIGNAETFDGTAADEVLADDLPGVFHMHAAVPDSFGIDHDGGTVLALIEAAGLVDAYAAGETGSAGEILQFGVQVALSIGSAAWARRAFRADVVTDEDMAFKGGQEEYPPEVRVSCRDGAASRHNGFHISAVQALPDLRK